MFPFTKRTFARLAMLSTVLLLALPCLGQTNGNDENPSLLRGYLMQTMMTPASYLLTNPEQLKAFVEMLPPNIPFKILPAPANPDPFLHDFTVDFSKNLLAVAVRRNGTTNFPSFLGIREQPGGVRTIHFEIAAPTAEAYPLGWAVYSAVVVPRMGPTSVMVTTAPAKPRRDSKFPRLGE